MGDNSRIMSLDSADAPGLDIIVDATPGDRRDRGSRCVVVVNVKRKLPSNLEEGLVGNMTLAGSPTVSLARRMVPGEE